MALDYGQRGKRRSLAGVWLGIAPCAVAVAAVLASNWTYHRRLEVAQGWVSTAPPCPTIPAAAYHARYAGRERPSVFDGVTLARQYGHVICQEVDTRGGWGFLTHPVCQFTSANAIRVKAGGAEAFFEPGPGGLATVSVGPGGVRCALSSQFTLFHDPTN
ncbi:MAG: hypothetical protein ACHP9T_01955 [Caulobacterales bacterium]